MFMIEYKNKNRNWILKA